MGTGDRESEVHRRDRRQAQHRSEGQEPSRDTADGTQENTAFPQSQASTFLLQILPLVSPVV